MLLGLEALCAFSIRRQGAVYSDISTSRQLERCDIFLYLALDNPAMDITEMLPIPYRTVESGTLTVAEKNIRPHRRIDGNRRPQSFDHSGRSGGSR